MRRRFGRRRVGDEAKAIDARVLQRLVDERIVPAASLDPVGADDIPASLAALGRGQGIDGAPILVGFAPERAEDGLFAAVALAVRLHAQAGFTGETFVVAPRWSAEARSHLALLAGTPVGVQAVEAPGLAESTRVEPVVASPGPVALAALLRQPGSARERSTLERAERALRGLAAKHGGALRGYGSAIELVVLARRVAALRVDEVGVWLDLFVPKRSSERLGPEGLAEALDRLEGFVRKHLNDRKVRDGEEGLRGRLVEPLLDAAGLRDPVRWPLGGSDPELLDFVAVDSEGVPAVGAVRREVTLESLIRILSARLATVPLLPFLLEEAEPPVQVVPPKLVLAGAEWSGAARNVVRHLGLELGCFEIGQPGSRAPSVRPLILPPTTRVSPARAEPKPSSPVATDVQMAPTPPEPPRAAAPAPPQVAEPEAPARSFEEVSIFDLEEEADRGGEARSSRGRRRRGRGRRGRRGTAEGSDEPSDSTRSEASPGDVARDARPEQPEPSRRGRRGSPGGGERPGRGEALDLQQELLEEDEGGALVPLAPDAPEFDLEPAPPDYEDEEEEESDPLRRERERRTRARLAKAAPETEPEAPAEPRPPRRRAAIVAHADRNSVAAAVLLARDLRLLEGIWVYPQSELMTFFRSVATDLREETPIHVIGFTASPARDVLQAASLYRGRITWFDHHEWPPEDLGGLQQAIGEEAVRLLPRTESSLAGVLQVCTRRSRFSDKLVDLVTARFTEHDYERWGRVWWWRLTDVAARSGERRADLEPLLVGRPSDLAREAASVEPPPPPLEAEFAAQNDFRLVHFGAHALAIVPVPVPLDPYLSARIVRERYGAPLSLSYRQGDSPQLLVFGADDRPGRRSVNVAALVQHLAGKFSYAEVLSDADHVARIRVTGLGEHPERLEEIVAEIAMSRSVLEG